MTEKVWKSTQIFRICITGLLTFSLSLTEIRDTCRDFVMCKLKKPTPSDHFKSYVSDSQSNTVAYCLWIVRLYSSNLVCPTSVGCHRLSGAHSCTHYLLVNTLRNKFSTRDSGREMHASVKFDLSCTIHI